MTYEEAIKKARCKLVGWQERDHVGFKEFYSHSHKLALDVNRDSAHTEDEGVLALAFIEDGKYVLRLENLFKDPFNATQEEAELFKLERGFKYPSVLLEDATNG